MQFRGRRAPDQAPLDAPYTQFLPSLGDASDDPTLVSLAVLERCEADIAALESLDDERLRWVLQTMRQLRAEIMAALAALTSESRSAAEPPAPSPQTAAESTDTQP